MTQSQIDLAFNPSQPRDHQGKWSRIAGAVERAVGAGSAVEPLMDYTGGIWGPGRTYAQHTADLAKLSPAQRRIYVHHVTSGKSPHEALQLARGGRLGRMEARVSRFINTPPPPSKHPLIPGYANEAHMETIDLARVHPSETAGGRKSALKRGLAIKPPSPGAPPGFPITDANHWEKARQAIGRVKSPARRAAVAKLLRKTAPRFGKTAALGKSWAAPGGKKAVAASNIGGQVIDMARRLPVMDPSDIVVTRGSGGQAVIRHRRGGGLIGTISQTDDGWISEPDGGQPGTGHPRQRGALVELLGLYNRSTGTAQAAPQPLQPPPVQTPLMQQFGVPAIRLATPAAGASDGGRQVSGGGSIAGLSPRGVTIYKKLRRKMPADRALAFSRRAQSFGGKKAS